MKSSRLNFLKRLRKLEIGKCYISKDITKYGEGYILITRVHKGGNITAAFFLLDIFCLGVKDSFMRERLTHMEFENALAPMIDLLQECKYEEAHNWILGGIEFADEAGIRPHIGFLETQYILEEDNDDIPLIEYEYGYQGKHHFVATSEIEWIRIKPILDKNFGEDNYTYMAPVNLHDSSYLNDHYEEFEKQDNPYNFFVEDDKIPYTYQHPNYPSQLRLHHPWLHDELYQEKYGDGLPDEVIDRILALPHDELRQDLEQIILYHIGLTCDEIPENYEPDGFTGIIGNSVILLGEVGNSDTSLDVVLETLRQNQKFNDFHFGDFTDYIVTTTLYKLGGNHLDKLMEYYKEEGLNEFSKCRIPTVINLVYYLQPERKTEVQEWYCDALQFAANHISEKKTYNSALASFLLCDLMRTNEEKLIPLVQKLFDTNLVSTGICGTLEDVIHSISDHNKILHTEYYPLEIHEHFKQNIRALTNAAKYQ